MEGQSMRKIFDTYNRNAKRFSVLKPLPSDEGSPTSVAEKLRTLMA